MLLAASALAAALIAPARAAAQPAAADPEGVMRVADRLNCPICQGYTLRECPLEVCAQMRAEIGRRLGTGESEEEVVAGFVALYGPSVLNEPPRRGFALLAWLAPPVVVGLAALGAVLRGRAKAAVARPGPAPAPEYVARAEAMARRDER